jgi:hypothetical protein
MGTTSNSSILAIQVIGLTAIGSLFSFTTVMPQQMMTAYAQLQLNADTICVLNPDQCEEARQQEFADSVQRGIEEIQREEYEERTGEEPPTTDELMESVEQEGEFDDERLANEAADNGIEDMQNMASETIHNGPDEQTIKTELLNATFSNLLKSTQEPEIEIIEEAVDMDEDDIERQVIHYEFAEDTEADDIGIYTLPNETGQSLRTAIMTNGNATEIELFENGRMIIIYEGVESYDEADDTTIYAPHNYTAIAGYIYDNSTIYEPDGTGLFENPQTSSAALSSSTSTLGERLAEAFARGLP